MQIITTAIEQSININSIVHVEVEGDLFAGMYAMTAAIDDYDYAVENDGSLDVWGTDEDGNEWRVNIAAA
jgi:hypothetical protein